MTDREIGYVYFQDFIPNNDYDIRIIVIGEKAFGIKRMVRKNDFRASGSGNIYYEKQHFGDETVGIAFDISKRLKSQCTAFDFVYDNKIPLIVEISYGFSPEGYNDCTGYWDSRLNWHEGTFDPYGWMVEMIIAGK
jgi:glutathione synthase/RimK-type ligase-like ATP-grasp enzyme